MSVSSRFCVIAAAVVHPTAIFALALSVRALVLVLGIIRLTVFFVRSRTIIIHIIVFSVFRGTICGISISFPIVISGAMIFRFFPLNHLDQILDVTHHDHFVTVKIEIVEVLTLTWGEFQRAEYEADKPLPNADVPLLRRQCTERPRPKSLLPVTG